MEPARDRRPCSVEARPMRSSELARNRLASPWGVWTNSGQGVAQRLVGGDRRTMCGFGRESVNVGVPSRSAGPTREAQTGFVARSRAGGADPRLTPSHERRHVHTFLNDPGRSKRPARSSTDSWSDFNRRATYSRKLLKTGEPHKETRFWWRNARRDRTSWPPPGHRGMWRPLWGAHMRTHRLRHESTETLEFTNSTTQ